MLSQAACDKAVVQGLVAPPRADVTCVSCGVRRLGVSLVYALAVALLSWSFVSRLEES